MEAPSPPILRWKCCHEIEKPGAAIIGANSSGEVQGCGEHGPGGGQRAVWSARFIESLTCARHYFRLWRQGR